MFVERARATGEEGRQLMEVFPDVEPIPLPAPVWLFKALNGLTLATHFVAVQLLLGALAIGLSLLAFHRLREDRARTAIARLFARRLPVGMAYVVNLGVPPLLFTQVLYGRALYTSSVLIGAYWISVIALVMGSYYGLYVAAGRAQRGKTWSSVWTGSLVLALSVAFIYTNNMTLMLRPEIWSSMYDASAAGVQLNRGDPTVLPRWLFMFVASFTTTGVGMVLLGQRSLSSERVGVQLRRLGASIAAIAAPLELATGLWVFRAQPGVIGSEVMNHPVYQAFAIGFVAMTALVGALAVFLWARASSRQALLAWFLAGVALVRTVTTVGVRDGIRDLTLLAQGFDVWDRAVATNWSVVGIFLVLLVVAIGVVGSLARVASRAKPAEDTYV